MDFFRIQKGQRLWRHGGALSEFTGIIWPGLVERLEERIPQAADFLRINRSPVSLAWQRIRLIDRCGPAHDLARLKSHLRIKVGPGRNASDLGIQFAADPKHGIADFLGNQSTGKKGGIQLSLGVFLFQFFRVGMPTASSVGFGGQNQGIQFLDRPFVLHEPVGQVIEQDRMGGQLTGTSKIIRIARDPPSEMPGPDTVDHDPGSERIFIVHDPVGQCQAPLALTCRERPRIHASERFGSTESGRNHGVTLRINAAPVVDNVRVEVSLRPGILRHLQSPLNVFHCYGFAGKNSMRDRLNAIKFDAVTDQVLEDA